MDSSSNCFCAWSEDMKESETIALQILNLDFRWEIRKYSKPCPLTFSKIAPVFI